MEVRPAPVVIGAILPESGSAALRQYGELIRQGIDIAFREHERAGGRQVELVVLDDGSDPARAAGLVGELERRNAVAVIGPLLSSSLENAGRARTNPDLVVISPTSSEGAPRLPNVYTLNSPDTRGAEALGAYAARSGGRIGLLYPSTAEFRAQAEAFKAAITRAGGRVSTEVAFDSATTTFARPLQQLRGGAVGTLFIPASERDIRQLAPQLEYYGITNVRVLGTEAWVSEDVLRSVQPRLVEGVVAATPLFRGSRAVAWDDFVGLYEATYRRTLDNPYPALGYDAARMVLSSIPSGRARAADVAAAIARLDDFRGATGVLSARGGAISRVPFLVRVQNGRPVLVQGPGS